MTSQPKIGWIDFVLFHEFDYAYKVTGIKPSVHEMIDLRLFKFTKDMFGPLYVQKRTFKNKTVCQIIV